MTRRDKNYLHEIVECDLNTDFRKGEILGLKWNQVRNCFIYLQKTKTSNPRQIPINDDLDTLFKRIRQRQGLSLCTYLHVKVNKLRIDHKNI